MKDDPWLDRWLEVMGPPRPDLTVLELGCGGGLDTEVLVETGYGVIAADLSETQLRRCERVAPAARLVLLDVREPLPFADASFQAIMASLCLHYFEWDRTERAMGEIHRCMCTGGRLAVRVNSTNDVNHGAVGHPEIGHLLYDVDGRHKRFFDRESLDRLLEGWHVSSANEMTIGRWELPKVVWEVFAWKR